MDKNYSIGVDLGATKIASALIDDQGKVYAKRHILTKSEEGVGAVLRRLAGEIQHLLALAPEQVSGIGIGVPGYVNPENGLVVDATNLSWERVNLLDGLKQQQNFELPVFIQMDTFASALGEYYFGAGRGCKDLIYLSIGSGISAGMIAGGRLITGSQNLAGQCGYYSLYRHTKEFSVNGPQDTAEEVLSGYGFLALARRLLAEGNLSSCLIDKPQLSTQDILNAARQADPLAVEVITEGGIVLSMLLAAYLSFFNPGLVIIGGGLGMAAFDLLVPVTLAQLKNRIIDDYYSNLNIIPSGQVSSALGAACLVFRQTLPGRFSI
jgi:glucokinase